MDFSWIFAPLLGGVIGYITNDLAIRMLFRPRKARYLLGHRLPLTPGLIPKEQENIAKSVGKAIAEQLLSGEVLREALLSEDMLVRVRAAAAQALERAVGEERTLGDFAQENETLRGVLDALSDGAEREIACRLSDDALHERLALALHGALRRRIEQSRLSILAGVLDAPASQRAVHDVVCSLLNENAPEIARMLTREGRAALLSAQPALLVRPEARREALCDAAVQAYRDIVEQGAQKAIAALDLSGVIERRIAALDMAQLEGLIMTLAKKELRAIVYLGAALGFAMGFLNLLL